MRHSLEAKGSRFSYTDGDLHAQGDGVTHEGPGRTGTMAATIPAAWVGVALQMRVRCGSVEGDYNVTGPIVCPPGGFTFAIPIYSPFTALSLFVTSAVPAGSEPAHVSICSWDS